MKLELPINLKVQLKADWNSLICFFVAETSVVGDISLWSFGLMDLPYFPQAMPQSWLETCKVRIK